MKLYYKSEMYEVSKVLEDYKNRTISFQFPHRRPLRIHMDDVKLIRSRNDIALINLSSPDQDILGPTTKGIFVDLLHYCQPFDGMIYIPQTNQMIFAMTDGSSLVVNMDQYEIVVKENRYYLKPLRERNWSTIFPEEDDD